MKFMHVKKNKKSISATAVLRYVSELKSINVKKAISEFRKPESKDLIIYF